MHPSTDGKSSTSSICGTTLGDSFGPRHASEKQNPVGGRSMGLAGSSSCNVDKDAARRGHSKK